jgi:hypothetical protein
MADLTQEQKQQVAQWAKEGARLADIQKRIREELGVSMTYMDARLLVIEMGLELKDVARPVAKPPAAPAPVPGRAGPAAASRGDAGDDGDADEPEGDAGLGAAVQVEVDRIMKPGSLVSGSVKFSDGTNATWALDQLGRLALGGTGPGYKPSQQDIVEFQVQLRKLLETRGY